NMQPILSLQHGYRWSDGPCALRPISFPSVLLSVFADNHYGEPSDGAALAGSTQN
ncbi:hypothetical protein AAVH_33526, partial [Aphelenchoides avenae]